MSISEVPRLRISEIQPEKRTKEIIIGQTRDGKEIKIRIEQILHQYLTAIKSKTHSDYAGAYHASALEGAPILAGKLFGVVDIGSDKERFSERVRACASELMKRNSISFNEAISLILEEGAAELELNGYESAHEIEAAQEVETRTA